MVVLLDNSVVFMSYSNFMEMVNNLVTNLILNDPCISKSCIEIKIT